MNYISVGTFYKHGRISKDYYWCEWKNDIALLETTEYSVRGWCSHCRLILESSHAYEIGARFVDSRGSPIRGRRHRDQFGSLASRPVS